MFDLPVLKVFIVDLVNVIHQQSKLAVGLRCQAVIALEVLFSWIVQFLMHFQITRQNEYFVTQRAWEWLVRILVMFLQCFLAFELFGAKLTFNNVAVKLHVSLKMVF